MLAAGLASVLAAVHKASCMGSWWTPSAMSQRLCYSDIPPLYSLRGMALPAMPYRDYRFEYPALTGMFSYAAAIIADRYERLAAASPLPGANGETIYCAVTLVGLGLCAILSAEALRRLAPDRPWLGVLMVALPTFVLTALINWDLLAIACVTAALLAWQRDRPFTAGALIGLGTAAKLYPVLLLGALLLVCARTHRWRELRAATVGAAAVWVAVNAPLAASGQFREGWWYFYRFSGERGDDSGSLWYVVGQLGGGFWTGDASRLSTAQAVAFALLAVAIGALCWRAPAVPDVAQVALLLVGAFLLANKVWSVQYVGWLAPLVLLTVRRTWLLVAWQAAELCYLVAVWWYLFPQGAPMAVSQTTYLTASIERWLALTLILGTVALDVWRAPVLGRIGNTAVAPGTRPHSTVGDDGAAP